jgi:hypothetical protein
MENLGSKVIFLIRLRAKNEQFNVNHQRFYHWWACLRKADSSNLQTGGATRRLCTGRKLEEVTQYYISVFSEMRSHLEPMIDEIVGIDRMGRQFCLTQSLTNNG